MTASKVSVSQDMGAQKPKKTTSKKTNAKKTTSEKVNSRKSTNVKCQRKTSPAKRSAEDLEKVVLDDKTFKLDDDLACFANLDDLLPFVPFLEQQNNE